MPGIASIGGETCDKKTNLVDVTYSGDIPNGKALWRATADFDLHNADTENYLTLMLMTAIKK